MPQAKAPDGPGIEVSKPWFCEIMGWTGYTFDQWVRKGLPVKKRPANRQDDYLLDSGVAIRWLLAQARGAAGGAGEAEGPLDYNAEKARLTKEQADARALRELADRLTAELADLRRPRWRRLMGELRPNQAQAISPAERDG